MAVEGVRVRNGQACEDAACEHQADGDAQVQPETGVLGRLGQLLFGERAHDAAQREGLDQRSKSVEDADKQHVDAPGPRRAIEAAHGASRARGADGGGHGRCSTQVQWESRVTWAEGAWCSEDVTDATALAELRAKCGWGGRLCGRRLEWVLRARTPWTLTELARRQLRRRAVLRRRHTEKASMLCAST